MKKSLITIAIAGALGLSAFTATAEEAYDGSWYALPGVSFMHPDSDLESDNGGGGFIRLGKEVSQHWDVQLGLSHARADEDLNVAGADGRYKQTILGVDALYMFSRERFRPFLLAGLGVARNDVDYDLAGADIGGKKTSWMANLGAGAQFMFTERFGMQADVRHVWSRADVPGSPLTDDDEKTVGNTYLNIGGIFRFGAPKQVAAAEPEPMPAAEPAPEPAVEAAPAAEPAPAPPAFEKITLDSQVLFGFDKDILTSEGKQKLDTDVVDKMKAHPEVELVLITGHTDRIGSTEYNQDLSERRAASVKKYLTSQGIAESRLHTVGKGESEPVVDCKGLYNQEAIDCLQPNRRVVVEIEEQR